ncbi:MAG: metallophosphoesterase family protein [Phycisphaerae bacterium]|jgi:hypothetical protein|nr:metallophosphoesterase family protein [Phycisphaerae bacterium]MDP7286787.1 metallophosphoesterase family protein [Phycisphaerae bacterium]
MLIGLLSDSHAHAPRLRKAVSQLAELGVDALVHCGDIVATDHVSILASVNAPVYLAAGNMDRNPAALAKEADKWGVNFAPDFVEAPLGGGQYLIALHGDDQQMLFELAEGGQFPYIIHGHTHCTADKRFGSVRVICPGAITSPRDPKHPTAAILDTEADTLKFIDVD